MTFLAKSLLTVALTCSSLLLGQSVNAPLKVGGDVKPPTLVKQVAPKYPKSFLHRPKQGEVLVHLVVDEKGMPTDISVLKSVDQKLDDAAVNAVSQYRFTPATRNDVPVAVEIRVSVTFTY